MNQYRKNSERIILIHPDRIEIFNPETGEWEKITNIPYIPLIINTNISEINNVITSEISFTFPYTNEPVPAYETETYIIDEERNLTYVRSENEEYNSTENKIRYNNAGKKTLGEKRKYNNEFIMECVQKVRDKIIDLAERLQKQKRK